jgi:hypothetical protein
MRSAQTGQGIISEGKLDDGAGGWRMGLVIDVRFMNYSPD